MGFNPLGSGKDPKEGLRAGRGRKVMRRRRRERRRERREGGEQQRIRVDGLETKGRETRVFPEVEVLKQGSFSESDKAKSLRKHLYPSCK